jgi:hypothetical protein
MAKGDGSKAEIDRTIDSVRTSYESFRAIPSFSVDYSLHYELLAGRRTYVFDAVSVVWKRAGSNQRLSIKTFMPEGKTLFRDYAWNERIGTFTEMLPDMEHGVYTTSFAPDTKLLYYNYFVNFMNYPDATGSLTKFYKGKVKSPASRTIWLPQSLEDNRASLIVSDSRDGSERADCIRIECPGKAIYWFDPSIGYAMRRHDILTGDSKFPKSKTTFTDFVQVGKSWLPKKMVIEEFAVHDEASSHFDITNLQEGTLLSRKTLVVNSYSLDSIPQTEFVVPAPTGVERPESVDRAIFTNFTAVDTKHVDENVVFDRQMPPFPKNRFHFVMIAGIVSLSIILMIAMLLLAVRVRTSNSSQGSISA